MTPSYKGMTSEKAGDVKNEGHAREDEFAFLIGGSVIPGHGKGDVRDTCRKKHSVKAGKKLQICLHASSSIPTVFRTPAEMVIRQAICDVLIYPENLQEYERDTARFKNLLAPAMRALADVLKDPENLRLFFKRTFFNSEDVDYLTILSDPWKFSTFSRAEVLDVLVFNATVLCSEGDQKVIFKYPVGLNGRVITVGEIEIRHDQHHVNEFKFWMSKQLLFVLLSEHLEAYSVPRDPAYCPPVKCDPQNRIFDDVNSGGMTRRAKKVRSPKPQDIVYDPKHGRYGWE